MSGGAGGKQQGQTWVGMSRPVITLSLEAILERMLACRVLSRRVTLLAQRN